jgi:flagellar assembly protein FliH
MPSSKIVRTEGDDNIIYAYQPKEFPKSLSNEAIDFIEREIRAGSEFQLNELISSKAGVAERLKSSLEEKIEALALEKLREVEEAAYKEAYAIGLEEGAKKAYVDNTQDIKSRLENVSTVLKAIEESKKDLLIQNEAYMIKLVYLIASRIAMHEIQFNQELIVSVLREIVDASQGDENIVVKMSRSDFDFLENLKAKAGAEIDALRRIKLEPNEVIQQGGCILESNYGVINATVEKRVEKTWEAIQDKLPRGHGLSKNAEPK